MKYKYTKANEYLKRGLLKIQRTMETIKIPTELHCVLCANNSRGHLLEAMQTCKEDLESNIDDSQQRINKAQSLIYDEESSIEQDRISLEYISNELKTLEEN
jgi:hypothetical protein